MNTFVRRIMVVAGLSTAVALPLSSQASDGVITFSGSVEASTCVVSVNGQGASTTVTLPNVDQASLTSAASKTTAAGTFFNIAVTGCTGSGNVQVYFEAGPNVDEATGGLINTAGGGSNVEVNLYNASGSTVVGTQIMPGTTTNQPSIFTQAEGAGNTGVTQWIYAGYSTAGVNGAASVGAVSTTVTYSLIYS